MADSRSVANRRSRRVVVLVLPNVHLLDLAGPVQAFYEATGFGAEYRIVPCAVQPKVRSAQGFVFADLAPLPEVDASDTVLVPGLDSSTLDRLEHVPSTWLRSAAATGARIASICSGAFALAHAGVLDGRQCTTHWKVVDLLQARCPRAQVLRNRLFVQDGNVLTSAGLASGIDMALALLEKDHGPLLVARVTREMVVYLRRSGDRDQTSIYLDYRTHVHEGVHRVQDWIVAHSDENPTIDDLATVAAMSPRNLTRVFRQTTGITLKTFCHKVKLQVARDLLHSPALTMESISKSCGFNDARQLRRLWKRTFGVNPTTWRETANREPTR
jgi:transcriptional regulator GlxA family with amidase domain